MIKRWLIGGVIGGGAVVFVGGWEWAVATVVFCLSAAYSQYRMARA